MTNPNEPIYDIMVAERYNDDTPEQVWDSGYTLKEAELWVEYLNSKALYHSYRIR